MSPALDIVVAVNDPAVLEHNLLRSQVLKRPDVMLHQRRGFPSAGAAYLDAMRHCRAEVLVFAHQDVYLPAGWHAQLMRGLQWLDLHQPDWAVAGVYGVTAAGRHVGCVWSSGLGSLFGQPLAEPVPVVSIDEVLIVLKRSSGVNFDAALPGYHLYATDLVQSALARGLGAHVLHAPLVHNSRPCLYLGLDFFAAYAHVTSKWRDRLPIAHNVAPLVRPGPRYLATRLRHRWAEWRHGPLDRARLDRHLDCVWLAHELGFE